MQACAQNSDAQDINMLRGYTTATMTQWRILDSIPANQAFFVKDSQGSLRQYHLDKHNILTLDNLREGQNYQLFYGTHKKFLMSFKQPISKANPSVVFASCLDKSWFELSNTIENSLANYLTKLQNPVMFWLGDMVYFNKDDLSNQASLDHAWLNKLTDDALQKTLKYTPNYAIWDDHDFGLNDADSTVPYKNYSFQSFNKYWLNPPKAFEKLLTFRFRQGDVEFFVLDNRMLRAKLNINKQGKQMFGEQQIKWLKQNLQTSNAKFKLVINGGQFFNDDRDEEGWYHFKNERNDFTVWLTQNPISGLLFISGDRHHSTLFSRKISKHKIVYELTCSALTSQSEDITEESYMQVQRYVSVKENNFCHLKFDSNTQKIDIQIIGEKGSSLANYTLNLTNK